MHAEGTSTVYCLTSDAPDDCTAVYLGCLITEDTKCPACGAEVQETVEVEYSDKCELCESRPNGKTWYWDSVRQLWLGLCDACRASPTGEAWVSRLTHSDSQSSP
jgi:hypothetical protein